MWGTGGAGGDAGAENATSRRREFERRAVREMAWRFGERGERKTREREKEREEREGGKGTRRLHFHSVSRSSPWLAIFRANLPNKALSFSS